MTGAPLNYPTGYSKATDLNAYRAKRQLSCSQTIEGHLFNEGTCKRCGLTVT